MFQNIKQFSFSVLKMLVIIAKSHEMIIPGRVAQLVMCLAADLGVAIWTTLSSFLSVNNILLTSIQLHAYNSMINREKIIRIWKQA